MMQKKCKIRSRLSIVLYEFRYHKKRALLKKLSLNYVTDILYGISVPQITC